MRRFVEKAALENEECAIDRCRWRIGSSLRSLLGEKYHFRSLDTSAVANEDDVVIADIRELEPLMSAMNGMDAVIHLAGIADQKQPWDSVLSIGIGGTYNVLEAARRAGVRKVIYASSMLVHAWADIRDGKNVLPDLPIDPEFAVWRGQSRG